MFVVELESSVAALMVQRRYQSVLLNEEVARFLSITSVILWRERNIFEYLQIMVLCISWNLDWISNN